MKPKHDHNRKNDKLDFQKIKNICPIKYIIRWIKR